MKKRIAFLILFQLLSCKGQDKDNCSKENAYNKVTQIQEVAEAMQLHKNSNQKIVFEIDESVYNNKKYYIIKEEQEGEFHNSVWNIFYVNKKDCSLYYYDTVSGNLLTLEKWRLLGKKNNDKNKIMEETKFTDIFNEGTVIKFTPQDLDKKDVEIQNFKQKLELYEKENPLIEDFDNKNLSYLINNETFFDVQYYIDNSWLQYFITKYKVDVSKLNDLMNLSIHQEDFNAVKLLTDNGYIISKKDLNILIDTENNIKEKVQENKSDGYESYIISNSKINQISQYLKEKYSLNKIADPDGYTNLRKDKNTSSEVLQKVKSGEHIEVLDNTGDWFFVKTKEGKEGYIHKSRIKSK